MQLLIIVETAETIQFSSCVNKILIKIRKITYTINRNNSNPEVVDKEEQVIVHREQIFNLPKLNIKTFTSKPIEWPVFIESHETVTDINSKISIFERISTKANLNMYGRIFTNNR